MTGDGYTNTQAVQRKVALDITFSQSQTNSVNVSRRLGIYKDPARMNGEGRSRVGYANSERNCVNYCVWSPSLNEAAHIPGVVQGTVLSHIDVVKCPKEYTHGSVYVQF